jgi:hypothetical protein
MSKEGLSLQDIPSHEKFKPWSEKKNNKVPWKRNYQSVKSQVNPMKTCPQLCISTTGVLCSLAYLLVIFFYFKNILIKFCFFLLCHLGKFFYQPMALKSTILYSLHLFSYSLSFHVSLCEKDGPRALDCSLKYL